MLRMLEKERKERYLQTIPETVPENVKPFTILRQMKIAEKWVKHLMTKLISVIPQILIQLHLVRGYSYIQNDVVALLESPNDKFATAIGIGSPCSIPN